MEHIIVAGALDEDATWARLGPELKRAIGRGFEDDTPVWPVLLRLIKIIDGRLLIKVRLQRL
jgi:hypothetical protein